MMMLSEAAGMIDARLVGDDALFTSVSKDTRDIGDGALYIAIEGERFDGHDFLQDAEQAGAVGALVHGEHDCKLAQLQVENTLAALGKLAAGWRQRFTGSMIGLTGSNGKTTVKEMCRHVMASVAGDEQVLATQGNLNNDIGMPMTLLRLRESHRYAVIEMGANHVGEIGYLTNIARPDVALVNNAGPAHLEGFGSLDNIARAKAEIYSGLGEQGIAIINLDDHYAPLWLELCAPYQRMTFSIKNAEADVYCETDDKVTVCYGDERSVLELPVPGQHNLANAMAATTASLATGIALGDITSALADFSNIGGRLATRSLGDGSRVIDDSYNANPMSVRAGIDVLSAQQGKRILVLGDMGELGDDASRLHAEIGAYAKQRGIDSLYTCGELSAAAAEAFGGHAHRFATTAEVGAALESELGPETVLLVKGSRYMKMELVIEALESASADARRRGMN